jgi:glycosyltransferase involved in cell wall biosynthesis
MQLVLGIGKNILVLLTLRRCPVALPCLLTHSGGIPYAIREKDVAVFVEERNIIQLREAITRLVDSEQERREMAKRAREYVECYYSLPIIAEKYHRMIQRGWDSNSFP